MAYWYNIETKQVESDEQRSPGADVMGPYDSPEEAGRALQTAAENTERWDEEDEAERRWEDGEGASPAP